MDDTVTALDELLCRDDFDAVAAQMREGTPASLRDQVKAAADESRDSAHRHAARQPGMRITSNVNHRDVPEWLRMGMLATLAGWFHGELSATCAHMPHPDRPEPVCAAAWAPGTVVCRACAPALRAPEGSVTDRTCDRCGTVTDGDMYAGYLVFGPLTYFYGTCAACREE